MGVGYQGAGVYTLELQKQKVCILLECFLVQFVATLLSGVYNKESQSSACAVN